MQAPLPSMFWGARKSLHGVFNLAPNPRKAQSIASKHKDLNPRTKKQRGIFQAISNAAMDRGFRF